jgi:hypothetical protein
VGGSGPLDSVYATVQQSGEREVVHTQVTQPGDAWVVLEGAAGDGGVLLDHVATGEREQHLVIRGSTSRPACCGCGGRASVSTAAVSARPGIPPASSGDDPDLAAAIAASLLEATHAPVSATLPHTTTELPMVPRGITTCPASVAATAASDARLPGLDAALRLSAAAARATRAAAAAAAEADELIIGLGSQCGDGSQTGDGSKNGDGPQCGDGTQSGGSRGDELVAAPPMRGEARACVVWGELTSEQAAAAGAGTVRLLVILPDGSRTVMRARAAAPLHKGLIRLARHALCRSLCSDVVAGGSGGSGMQNGSAQGPAHKYGRLASISDWGRLASILDWPGAATHHVATVAPPRLQLRFHVDASRGGADTAGYAGGDCENKKTLGELAPSATLRVTADAL